MGIGVEVEETIWFGDGCVLRMGVGWGVGVEVEEMIGFGDMRVLSSLSLSACLEVYF